MYQSTTYTYFHYLTGLLKEREEFTFILQLKITFKNLRKFAHTYIC